MPKERRKGKKEIHKGNLEILSFYLKFSIAGTVVQLGHFILFFLLSSSFSLFNIVWLVFAVGVHFAGHKLLRSMARPVLGDKGELVESGTDISDAFIAEYAVDFIILTTGVQILSAISNYFWLLWLLGPGYLFYKLWVSILWPWFKSGSQESSEGDSKKNKQRPKMRRVH